MKRLLITLCMAMFLTTPAWAGTVEDRLREADNAIDAGVRSGELVSDEAQALKKSLAELRKDFEAAKDGFDRRLDALKTDTDRLSRNEQKDSPKFDAEIRSLRERIGWLQERVDQGRRDGSLVQRETVDIESGLDAVRGAIARHIEQGTLSRDFIDEMNSRLNTISDRLNEMRHNKLRRR